MYRMNKLSNSLPGRYHSSSVLQSKDARDIANVTVVPVAHSAMHVESAILAGVAADWAMQAQQVQVSTLAIPGQCLA